jgi:hypothetical protein
MTSTIGGRKMKDARQEMNAQLKTDVVPHLRSIGFRGSLPHFRRITDAGVDLLTFQFRLGGGSFVVEAAYKGPYKVTAEWGNHVPPEKLTAHDLNKRRRIGRRTLGLDDPWFDFSSQPYSQTAQQVITSLPEAEDYWREQKAPIQPPQTTPGSSAPLRV